MADKKEINALVGANIKREREHAGLTQEAFSEKIGLGAKSLSALERGVVGASLTTITNICQVLGISSDMLLFEYSQENNLSGLTAQLSRLSPEQFAIVRDVVGKLLEAFDMENPK